MCDRAKKLIKNYPIAEKHSMGNFYCGWISTTKLQYGRFIFQRGRTLHNFEWNNGKDNNDMCVSKKLNILALSENIQINIIIWDQE